MPQINCAITPQGAVIDIWVGVSLSRKTVLEAHNLPVPTHRPVRALIDTGASNTYVDPSILKSFRLSATGKTYIHTPSTGNKPHEADQYDVGISFPSLRIHALDDIPVTESHLVQIGLQALIGRDVVKHCVLIYNGEQSTCTLSF